MQRETVDGLRPHRVQVRADNAIERGVPQDPLTRMPPRGLHFSVDFMKALAEEKHSQMTCPCCILTVQ